MKKRIKVQKAIKKRFKGFVSPEVALAGKPRSGSDWSCCSDLVFDEYFCLLLLEDETLISCRIVARPVARPAAPVGRPVARPAAPVDSVLPIGDETVIIDDDNDDDDNDCSSSPVARPHVSVSSDYCRTLPV